MQRLAALLVALFLPATALTVATAAPAAADPAHYVMWSCADGQGIRAVKRINQCPDGQLSGIDSYTGKKLIKLDGFCTYMAAKDGKTERQIVAQCTAGRRMTMKQALTLAKVAITCYVKKKPTCLLPLLKL
jgi:hypothetical protein